MFERGRLPLFVLCAALAACGGERARAPETPRVAPEGHATHARTVTLEWLAETAILLEGMGDHHRAITTRSREAQAYFDQGLTLLYAFNHDEAARSFAKAAALDPSCAMCLWGTSLTLGPNYNVPMLAERSALAWEALGKAKERAPSASPVERALVGALSARYGGPEYRSPAEQQPYTEAYAAAMREVARGFPDDVDVQVLAAEALMNVAPWRLFGRDGEPGPHTLEIIGALERALERAPRHPGANHYYIHAVEASSHPERALPSADRLADLVPGAGHLVHMPAHVYQRVGRYADASAHNRRAAQVDLAYMAQIEPWGYYPMYLGHNYGFLAFSASMEGRGAEALWASRQAAKALPPEMLEMMPGMDFMVAEPLLVMVRFGKWDELVLEPRPDPRYPVLSAFWLHGHGMALAAKGWLIEARSDHAELVRLTAEVSPELRAGNNSAKDVMDVAAKVLEARIAQEAKDSGALDAWSAAVDMADALAYSEPNDWFYPVRHHHGAALLDARMFAEAEAVYREDLRRNPENGWALFGLAQALGGQGRRKEAAAAEDRFQKAWARADQKLTRTAW